jgi:hypothetical protein
MRGIERVLKEIRKEKRRDVDRGPGEMDKWATATWLWGGG